MIKSRVYLGDGYAWAPFKSEKINQKKKKINCKRKGVGQATF